MRQLVLSDDTKRLHEEYFENNVLKKLDDEIKSKDTIFIDEEINKFKFGGGIIYNANKIQAEHKEFIKFCRRRWKCISIGQPNVLNAINKKIERNFKGIRKLLKEDFKFCDNNINNKGKKYSNLLLDLFGYNDFEKANFFEIIKNRAKEIVKFRNNINKDINYDFDVQKEMVSILIKLFPKIKIQIKDKLLTKMNEPVFKKILKKLENRYFIGLTIDNYNNTIFGDSWNAYIFVLMSGIRTCPYCNRQYIAPILTSSGQMRGDLDHFLPKSKFPYFSMSLYNLIPVCKFCNSSLKGSDEFTYNDLNPYEGSFNEHAKFYADIKVNKPIGIHIVKKRTYDKKSINKFLNTFKLELQYSYHTNQVKELIQKRLAYSEEYIRDIKHNIFKDCITEKRLKEILIGYSEDELKINNEPLTKFRRDIVKQLKFFNDSDTDLIEQLKKLVESQN